MPYLDSATVHVSINESKYNKHAQNRRNGAPGGHVGEDRVPELALRPLLGNPCVLLHTADQHHAIQDRKEKSTTTA